MKPPSPTPPPALQHNREIHENLAAWERKPALRGIYRHFHELLAGQVTRAVPGITLELGSGIGRIKDALPECVTSDIFPNPWLDRQENAYALSEADGAVANLILFDVWHHLEFPGTALQEFARIVRPGGRLLIFDPDMSVLGRLLYGRFHHEGLGSGRPISWLAPAGFEPAAAPYFTGQAAAHRIFVRRETVAWERDWSLVRRRRLASLAYAGTGGFRGPQLYPAALRTLVQAADRALSLWPSLFSNRILVVLERRAG